LAFAVFRGSALTGGRTTGFDSGGAAAAVFALDLTPELAAAF
jgi:hypothetical protein